MRLTILLVSLLFSYVSSLDGQVIDLQYSLEPSVLSGDEAYIYQRKSHFYDKDGFLWFVNSSGCMRCDGYGCDIVYDPRHYNHNSCTSKEFKNFQMTDSLVLFHQNCGDSIYVSLIDRSSNEIIYYAINGHDFDNKQQLLLKDDHSLVHIYSVEEDSLIFLRLSFFHKERSDQLDIRDQQGCRITYDQQSFKLDHIIDYNIIFFQGSFIIINSDGLLVNEVHIDGNFITAYGNSYDIDHENIYYYSSGALYKYHVATNEESWIVDITRDLAAGNYTYKINVFEDVIFATSEVKNFMYHRQTDSLYDLTSYFNKQFSNYEDHYSKEPINQISELYDHHYLISHGTYSYIFHLEDLYTTEKKRLSLQDKSIRGMCLLDSSILGISYYQSLTYIDPKNSSIEIIPNSNNSNNYLTKGYPYHLSYFKDQLIASISIISPEEDHNIYDFEENLIHACHAVVDDTLHIFPWKSDFMIHYDAKGYVSTSKIDSIFSDQEISDVVYDHQNIGFWVLPLHLGPHLLDRNTKEVLFSLDKNLQDLNLDYYDLEFYNSSLYVGTNHGVLEIDLQSFYTKLHPLYVGDSSFRSVYNISSIHTDTLILGTSQGIYAFDTNAQSYLIHEDFGYYNKFEFNRASNLLVDSILFLGSTTGLHRLPIKKLKWRNVERSTDSLFIFNAIINQDTIDMTSFDFSNDYLLSHQQQNIKLHVAVPRYDIPYSYAYKSSEVNSIWSKEVRNSYIEIQNIPYGKSSFEIRATPLDQQKSSCVKTIKINRNKPIYLQWWFTIGSSILLSFLVIMIYKKLKSYTKEVNIKISRIKAMERLSRHDFINYLEGIKRELFTKQSLDPKILQKIILKLDSTILNKELESNSFLVKRFNVIPLIRDTIDLYNKLYSDCQINLLGSKRQIFKGNKEVLQLIIENLISNIYKHHNNSSELTLMNHDHKLIIKSSQYITKEVIDNINKTLEYPKPLEKANKGLELCALLAKNVNLKVFYSRNGEDGYTIEIIHREIIT